VAPLINIKMEVSKTIVIMIILFFSFNRVKSQENRADLPSIYDSKINIKSIGGGDIDFKKFSGKKILIVNVASKCGFTSQYKELQALYSKHKDDLMIVGVPCNQFGRQEPGSLDEIKSFCSKNYGVEFLMTEKIEVKGEGKHALYKWLTDKNVNGVNSSSVKWNFQKYLLDENGRFVNFFYSSTKPSSEKITKYLL